MATQEKDWGKRQVLMALSYSGGYIGLDRFYKGQIGWGILKAITLGAFGVWWLIDAIRYTIEAGKA